MSSLRACGCVTCGCWYWCCWAEVSQCLAPQTYSPGQVGTTDAAAKAKLTFETVMRQLMARDGLPPLAALQTEFRLADVDGSGTLSRSEVQRALRQWGCPLSSGEVDVCYSHSRHSFSPMVVVVVDEPCVCVQPRPCSASLTPMGTEC